MEPIKNSILTGLPNELLLEICSNFEEKDLRIFTCVCKNFKALSEKFEQQNKLSEHTITVQLPNKKTTSCNARTFGVKEKDLKVGQRISILPQYSNYISIFKDLTSQDKCIIYNITYKDKPVPVLTVRFPNGNSYKYGSSHFHLSNLYTVQIGQRIKFCDDSIRRFNEGIINKPYADFIPEETECVILEIYRN